MRLKSFRRLMICAVVIALVAVALPAQVQTKAANQVEITYWDWWVSQGPTVDKGIAAFEKANPDIKVTKTTQDYANFVNLLNLAFQSDSAPDVFLVPEEAQLPLSTQMANGWYAPLDDMAGFDKWKAQYPAGSFSEGLNVIGGKTYSAPFFQALPNWQLYINLDLYKKAGLMNADGTPKLPKTWDDVIANSKVIKDKTGKYGWGFGNNVADWNFYMCTFSGGYQVDGKFGWDPKTGKFVFSTRPCFKQILQGLVTMKNENLLLPESSSINDEQARVQFANGDFAHLIGGTWIMNGWQKTNPNFKGTDYTAVPLPLVGTDTIQSYWYSGQNDARMWGINANSKNKDAAWKFYQYLNSPDFANLWTQDGNGLAYLVKDPQKYASNQAQKAVYSMGNLVRTGPITALKNPDAAKVQFTLTGASINDTIVGIITGQVTDLDAALKDLDDRSQAALTQGISDAVSGGAKVSIDDFIFKDWDPLQNYPPSNASASGTMAATMAATSSK